VDDDIVGIEQHPVRGREPFEPNVPPKSLLDLVCKLNRHRRHLPRRAARRDHHVIGDVGLAGERDRNDLLRLVVVERLENKGVELFDVDRSAVGGADGLRTFGQGVSWRITASRSLSFARAGMRNGDASWGNAHEWRLRT